MRRASAAALALLLLAACTDRGGDDGARATDTPSIPSPTDTAPESPATPRSRSVTVYLLTRFDESVYLAPERRTIARTTAVARASLTELLGGPVEDPDHFSAYPAGAGVRSVRIDDEKTATVDWNAAVLDARVGAEEETLGIQQVVWTLTEFPTIARVRFTVEGKASGRASNGKRIEDWWGHVGLQRQPFARMDADILEPVTIFAPADGAHVTSPVVASGEASVFEANVGIRPKDGSGKIVVQSHATASAGAPERGRWNVSLSFDEPASRQSWTLEAYESSPEDGRDTFVATRALVVGG